MIRTFLSVLTLALMTACGSPGGDPHYYAKPYTARHPIQIEKQDAALDLTTSGKQGGLSAADQFKLERFVDWYLTKGHGPLTVSTPIALPQAAHHLEWYLYTAGLNRHDVVRTTHQHTSGEPVIRFRFTRFTATPPKCGHWTHDASQTRTNGPMPNFGCAMQNNLAVLISDPRDLVSPRGVSPAYTERRTTILENYRTGEDTAVERSDQDSGSVSDVSQ